MTKTKIQFSGLIIVCVFVVLFSYLTGCATPDKSSNQFKPDTKSDYQFKPDTNSRLVYLEAHPEFEPNFKTAITEGRLAVGMNKEQVEAVYGLPCGTNFMSGFEIWAYAYNRNTSFKKSDGCYGAERFYFKDGKLKLLSDLAYTEWEYVHNKEVQKQKEVEVKTSKENKRKEYVRNKKGLSAAHKTAILEERIVIGMTIEDVQASWGKPKNINRTVGSWGVHEQWVYGSKNYLYFENGKLTSWQD